MANEFAITQKKINDIYVAFKRSFNQDLKSLKNNPESLGQLARVITTNTDTVKMPYYFDKGSGLNSWTPPEMKKVDQLHGGVLQLDIQDYEKTFQMRKIDIERDNLGIYRGEVEDLAHNVLSQDDVLIAALLAGGDSATGYDGVNFFATTHPTADSTQSNLSSGTLSATTLFSGVSMMRKFTGYNGEKLNIFPNCIVVPPDLEKTAVELMDSNIHVADSAASDYLNYFKGRVTKIIVSPYLTDTDDWYLVSLGQSAKPFIKATKNGYPKFVKSSPDGDMAFYNGALAFGVEHRMVIDYYAWQCAIKFTN